MDWQVERCHRHVICDHCLNIVHASRSHFPEEVRRIDAEDFGAIAKDEVPSLGSRGQVELLSSNCWLSFWINHRNCHAAFHLMRQKICRKDVDLMRIPFGTHLRSSPEFYDRIIVR